MTRDYAIYQPIPKTTRGANLGTVVRRELMDAKTAPNNLAELLSDLVEGITELSDHLPIFSDDGWLNPTGAWSWDATHAIVGTCVDDLEIVRRG